MLKTGIRPVSLDEVKIVIDEETKLICTMAATLFANKPNQRFDDVVFDSYKILDAVNKEKILRWTRDKDKEEKRRAGY